MKSFINLSIEENQALLQFPAFISLLAANSDGKLDEGKKKSAINFSHIKTYSCDPMLAEFYKEADKVFEHNILQLDRDLPINKAARDADLKKDLMKLEAIVVKLGKSIPLLCIEV